MADAHIGQIATALGDGALLLEGFTAEERFSEPFRITCDVLSPGAVDFAPLLGTGVSLTVDGGDLVGRAFHGLLAEASRVEEDANAVRYRLVLRPWLWFLSLGRNSRIFQAQSAMTIIQKVFADAGVSTSAYTSKVAQAGAVTREYCVQYGESDFAFASRLMEEEGVYYFFAHTADSHTMILCDGKGSHAAFGGGDLPLLRAEQGSAHIGPHLGRWDEHVKPVPTSVTLRDFHLRKFEDTLEAKNEETSASNVSAELYAYPGAYSHLTDDASTTGAAFAELRLQAARAEQLRLTGEGDVFATPVGSRVTVSPVDGQQEDPTTVLVVGAVHVFRGQAYGAVGAGSSLELKITFESVPSDTVWRPMQTTPKPLAAGPQIATVVGPAGEVIHVDAYGRVRVQFPWDRLGKKDETAGCWIRVSQAWADGGFGHMHIPRIGEEVIVDYFDGDMDRPVITGRVYNATKTVPYALPDDKTKSTWKSQTVGDSGSYDDTVDPPSTSTKGFNEIRFEDKGGSEEVFVHAQRLFTGWYRFDETRTTGHNTTIKVGYNRDITIKNNETKKVEDGDETHTISKGGLTTTISKGDETRNVDTGKRTTTIMSDEKLTVTQGNMSTTVSTGNQSTEVSLGNITVKADAGSISMEALQKIELKVGMNSVTIDMTGVTIKGMNVQSEAQLMHSGKGMTTQLQGTAMTTITGGIVMIN